MDFLRKAIEEHKSSDAYKTAVDAALYASGKNPTITNNRKMLYKLSGEAVPDTYSPNYKCTSGFFRRFVTQQVSYILGNGITFDDKRVKERLGHNIDTVLYMGAKNALVQGVSFGYFNNDHVDMFKLTEFVPLWDEETGELKAGIRFWQLEDNRPLRMTLYELDGCTEYIQRKGEKTEIMQEKRPYIIHVSQSEVGGEVVLDGGENYPSFPIVPLWGNHEHQSEIVGRRELIDCYDIINSGFANDLDEATMFYWTISKAGGMDEVDLAKFKQQMKTLKTALVEDDSAEIQAHSFDVPYAARDAALNRIAVDLHKDFMALDVDKLAAGGVTATQIIAAYEPLEEKTDEFEMCLFAFVNGILYVAGEKLDGFEFKRSQIVNKSEVTDMVLSASQYLDRETILKKLPFLLPDEVDDILERLDDEAVKRLTEEQEQEDGQYEENVVGVSEDGN